ncbi:hypothetical protein [Catenulispora rubra]|uniref:hypothetical protein n=1 Tax=Catenulispora rubra TaxID=280293 RepID=UPI0018924B39|nr:hypothetical protein [Catenulispora rubra]
MGRRWAIAAGAAVAVLAVGGCGVQPTGVNVARVEPFGASPSSSPETASPSQYPYTVSLFMFSTINKGPGTMISRSVPNAPGPMSLPDELATLSADEQADQYTTYVPPGITLKPADLAHEYYVFSPTPLGPLALQQLTCTFDQWWIQHPDPNPQIRATTRLIERSTGADTLWQDCPEGVVPPNLGGAAAKPTAAGVLDKSTGQG